MVAAAVGDRPEGARARGVRDPAAAGGGRGGRRRHDAGSPATSGSGCAAFRSPLPSHADRAPEEIADEIVALAGAGERLPGGRGAARRLSASVPGSATPTASSRCARAGDDWLEIAIWNPDGSLAEMSGNGTRIAARWLAERTGATEVLGPGRPARGGRADARRTAWSSRTSARCASASRTRWRGSGSRPSTSATRTRSSRATRPSSTASARCSRRTLASRTARTSRSRAPGRPGDDRGTRLGARRRRDGRIRHERGRGGRRARRRGCDRPLPRRRPARAARRRTGAADRAGRAHGPAGASIVGAVRRRLLLLAIAVLALTTASTASAGPRWHTYRIETGGFSVGLPSSWIDVTRTATPAILKELARNRLPKAVAELAGRVEAIKLVAGDAAPSSQAFMDVGVDRVGAIGLDRLAAETARELKQTARSRRRRQGRKAAPAGRPGLPVDVPLLAARGLGARRSSTCSCAVGSSTASPTRRSRRVPDATTRCFSGARAPSASSPGPTSATSS